MPKEITYYSRLGVPIDASPEEIRHAYRDAARRLHPDASTNPEATELFLQIQQAYEILADPKKRADYDSNLPQGATVPPAITVTTVYSRPSLERMDESQLIYALLELSAQPDPDLNPGVPINVCLVVDCSTSMQGLYMDMVKSTAIELVRQLRAQDIISLVAFSDRAEVVVPPSFRSDPQHIETSIRMLQTGGGTEILQGLSLGYEQVSRGLRKDFVSHIILLTDGRTYGDEKDCLLLAEKASLQGIGISALGIGGKWNDHFLDQLTARTGGNSLFVNKPQDIKQFLKQKFNRLVQSYADQTTFHFETTEGVNLRYAFRLQPDVTPLSIESPIQMGIIPRDTPLTVLFEFMVDRVSPSISRVILADGRLVLDIPSRQIPVFTLRSRLERTTSQEMDPVAPPLAIMQAMSKLTLYRMQDHANQSIKEGDLKNATRRLQNLATNLLAQGQNELARTVLGEASNLEKKLELSDEGGKRIKYGTRSLLLPAEGDD